MDLLWAQIKEEEHDVVLKCAGMKPQAVTCGSELCFVPVRNGRRGRAVLGSHRTPGCQATVHGTVSSLVWWWRLVLSSLGGTLINTH